MDVQLILANSPMLLRELLREILWLQLYLQNLDQPPAKSTLRLGQLSGQLPDMVAMGMAVAAYGAAKKNPDLNHLAEHDVILTAPRWHLAQWSQQLWQGDAKAAQAGHIAAICASAVLLQTALTYQANPQTLHAGRMADMLRQDHILPKGADGLMRGGFWPAIFTANNQLLGIQEKIIRRAIPDPCQLALQAGEEIQDAMAGALQAVIATGAEVQVMGVIGVIGPGRVNGALRASR
jgi:hypothetical protein